MKKHFITGLIILLPLAVTILLVRFFFNLLTDPFVGIIGPILDYYGIADIHSGAARLISQLLILLVLFFLTVGLGAVTRWLFFHSLIDFGETLLNRIPFISPIYRTCKDVIQTIFSDRSTSFKQVVLVPFPSRDTATLGLVTRDNVQALTGTSSDLVAVFVPTTPNPTSGFLVMFKPEDLVYLDMPVEAALKFVISCGVIMTPVNPVKPP